MLHERDRLLLGYARRLPLLLKVSPDLDRVALEGVARIAVRARIDGIVATNTTVQRGAGLDASANQSGGLSGAPLHALALETVAALRKLVGPDMPIIGVGGIDSVAKALAMRDAGADLIQIYTGLVYRGPALVKRLVRAL